MTPQEHDALLKIIDRALVALETNPNLDDVERDDVRARLLASHLDLPTFPDSALSVIDQNPTADQLAAPSTAETTPLTRPATKRRAVPKPVTADTPVEFLTRRASVIHNVRREDVTTLGDLAAAGSAA